MLTSISGDSVIQPADTIIAVTQSTATNLRAGASIIYCVNFVDLHRSKHFNAESDVSFIHLFCNLLVAMRLKAMQLVFPGVRLICR